MSTRYVKETTSLATIYPTDWYPQPPTFQYLQEGSDSITNFIEKFAIQVLFPWFDDWDSEAPAIRQKTSKSNFQE
jgi:hypothetical protein